MTDTADTSAAQDAGGEHGLRYELFILALTIYSLVIMVLLVLPLEPAVLDLLRAYDNLICFVFLADFAMRLRASHPHRQYFLHGRGWLDLLGSIPSFGILRFTALFRLVLSSGKSVAFIMAAFGEQPGDAGRTAIGGRLPFPRRACDFKPPPGIPSDGR